jgi:DHA2 family methylenomycin A resistance protein-like MFS transporter
VRWSAGISVALLLCAALIARHVNNPPNRRAEEPKRACGSLPENAE